MSDPKQIPETPTPLLENQQLRDPSFWQAQWQNVRLLWRLLKDPEVPIYLKFIPFAAVVYLVVPVDLLPDVLLGLGQMDDLAVLLFGAKTFTSMVPQHLVDKHWDAIRREDGGWALPEKSVEQAIVINPEKMNK